MRALTLKYAGECRACGAALPPGASAVYERRVGVYCPPCAPTDPEAIRAARQEGADRKAARLEEWAAKRRTKAEALEARNAPYAGDIAFATQPGHIPERARVIARTDQALAHSETARVFEARAARLRSGVRVAGDAERAREAKREATKAKRAGARAWVHVGARVNTWVYGYGVVERVNRTTATVRPDGCAWAFRVDLSFLEPNGPPEA